jgi:ABC-type branched-subunit amino acid transport system ATPase component
MAARHGLDYRRSTIRGERWYFGGDGEVMAEEVLRTENLVKRFGGFTAVAGVSITFYEGERIGLIGPNGAGKTTFINLISGHLKPDSGKIFFKGVDVTKAPPYKKVMMGMNRTFQIPSIFKSLTVYQNVQLAAKKAGQPYSVDKLLTMLGLEKVADVKAANLSYGMMKIVELAMTMVSNPSILLLDEPTAGLTSQEKKQIIQVLRTLPERCTIVMVEHDIDLVFDFAGRVVVMHRGEVLSDGKPEEIAVDTKVREVYLG